MDARFYGPYKISQIKPEGNVMEIDIGNRKGWYNVRNIKFLNMERAECGMTELSCHNNSLKGIIRFLVEKKEKLNTLNNQTRDQPTIIKIKVQQRQQSNSNLPTDKK